MDMCDTLFTCLGTLILISQMHQVTKHVGLDCSCGSV